MTPIRSLLFAAMAAAPAVSAVERPFILWPREEAAAVRRTIETESWASNAYQRLCADKDPGQPVRNLFKYAVFGDAMAHDAEKQYPLSFIGAPVDGRERHCPLAEASPSPRFCTTSRASHSPAAFDSAPTRTYRPNPIRSTLRTWRPVPPRR